MSETTTSSTRHPSSRESASRALRVRARDARLGGWLFVLPALTAYALFVLWPIVKTIKYAFYSWDGILPAKWVGLANFKTVFTDHQLLGTLGHICSFRRYDGRRISVCPIPGNIICIGVMDIA